MEAKKEISYPKLDYSLFRYRPLEKCNVGNCDQCKFNKKCEKKNSDISLDRLLEEIKTGNIFLSRISNLNDPFETQFVPQDMENMRFPVNSLLNIICKKVNESYLYDAFNEKIVLKTDNKNSILLKDFIDITFKKFKSICDKKNKYKSLDKEKYKELIVRALRKTESYKLFDVLIASFSETDKSIPMWAYYANDYKGVCLEYDFTKVANEEMLSNMFKVSYSSKMPKNKNGYYYSPTIKSIEWSHEQEWRLVFQDSSEKIKKKGDGYFVHMPYLKKVIIGKNIKVLNAMKIIKVVEELNEKNKNKIYIEMIVPQASNYKLIRKKDLKYCR